MKPDTGKPHGERAKAEKPGGEPGRAKDAKPKGPYGKPATKDAKPNGPYGKPVSKDVKPKGPYGKPATKDAKPKGPYGKPATKTGKPAGAGEANPGGKRSYAPRPSNPRPAATAPLGRGERLAGEMARTRPGASRTGTAHPVAARSGFVRPGAGRPGRRPPAGSFVRKPGAAPAESTGLSIGARRMALDVLRDVHQNGAFAQLSLHERLSGSPLKPVDKRLVTSIVYGTLENEIRIDYALDKFMERPTHEPVQRDILRLSACQILFHDRVPDSAAVNEGVNLAKGLGMESATGFLNAVLRNLSREKDKMEWPARDQDMRRYLHIMGSMPEWIVDKLLAAYGAEEAEKIIMHRQREHPMVVRPNLMRMTDQDFEALLEKKAWQARRGIAPHAFFISGAAEISLDNDYRDGLFSIQGQSSMLAAEAVQAKPGMRVLDACAAPGGKSAYLCETMQNTGRVFAWELHEKRAMLLESTKRRLNLESLRISVRDATEPKPDMDGTLDAVLLDAPCSGLGVMVQKPDLKYRLKPEDIAPIVQTQRALLGAVCGYVKPGGTLVYSTCSILPEENMQQIEAFLAAHPEFSVEPLPDTFPESLRAQETALGLQLLGYRDDVEGFYIVRMRRARAR